MPWLQLPKAFSLAISQFKWGNVGKACQTNSGAVHLYRGKNSMTPTNIAVAGHRWQNVGSSLQSGASAFTLNFAQALHVSMMQKLRQLCPTGKAQGLRAKPCAGNPTQGKHRKSAGNSAVQRERLWLAQYRSWRGDLSVFKLVSCSDLLNRRRTCLQPFLMWEKCSVAVIWNGGFNCSFILQNFSYFTEIYSFQQQPECSCLCCS